MIAENLRNINKNIPEHVTLVAVSKTKPNEAIQEAYDAGQRVFGENKALELRDKAESLSKDIEWHFIGHLQRNKVKYIAPFVKLIHAVDSLRLLEEIDKQAAKNNRVIDCLLQFHIAEETTKFGLSLEEADGLISSQSFQEFKHVRIVGVMGMATFTDNEQQIRREFATIKKIFDLLKNKHFNGKQFFNIVSSGMSNDYSVAIDEGSTMVRIGSSIFGERNYN